MRTLSDALTAAQAATERTPLGRLTIRDLRLQWETAYSGTLPQSTHTFYDFTNSILGDSCKESGATAHIHQVIAMASGGVDNLYYREVTDLTDWTGAWTDTSENCAARCRPGIHESSSVARMFYWKNGENQFYYRDQPGAATSMAWSGGTVDAVGFAPISNTVVYAYIKLNGISGHRLYRYTVGGSWETGPHIFTEKGQGNLYSETFIDAVTLSGVDYIVLLDHDDGRAVLVKYNNGNFSDPVSVLPMDIVSNPLDTTNPSSIFTPYSISVVNSKLHLTGRLIRPGSDLYGCDFEVLLRGDGNHWTLDRHHALWVYADTTYVGMKSYQMGANYYLIAPQKTGWCVATNLVGVDTASKKTTLTSDIMGMDASFPGVNVAATLSAQIANADGTYDNDTNIREDAEVSLELGWNDNLGNSGYVDMGVFSIDSKVVQEAYQADSLAIIARSASMKKILDWRASQSYDYFSQCKIHEAFEDLGGFTEWATGWTISDTGELQCTKLGTTATDTPEIIVDTTDWTTLDGVCAATRFRFHGTGNRNAGILLNATDEDYKSVIQASIFTQSISLYNMRDGTWDTSAGVISDTITFAENTWYDMAILYAAGLFRAFWKTASTTAWSECAGDFPYRWDKSYPAIEAEIYDTGSTEEKAIAAVGSRYSSDQGYVGLRTYARVHQTLLAQDVLNPDKGEDEDVETIVVKTTDGFPTSGAIKVDDEVILYSSIHTGDEVDSLRDDEQIEGEANIDVYDASGFPGHGIIIIDDEAVAYNGFEATKFYIEERGAGSTEAAAHKRGAVVRLDEGSKVRDCTEYFNAIHVSSVPTGGGTTTFLVDITKPWTGYNVVGGRLEITHVAQETGTAYCAETGNVDDIDGSPDPNDWWKVHDTLTLAYSGGDWDADEWEPSGEWYVIIDSGEAAGRWGVIASNTADVLTLTAPMHVGEGPNLEKDDEFEIWPTPYSRVLCADPAKAWAADQWNGYELRIPDLEFTSLIVDTLANEDKKNNRLVLADPLPTRLTDNIRYEIWIADTAEDQVLEIDRVEGNNLYPTTPFDEAPTAVVTYTIRGRGAYSTTPTSHAADTPVYDYVATPMEYDFLKVYSLGRDYTVDYLLRDICYRAGITSFEDVFLNSTSAADVSVASNSYTDVPLTLTSGARKNFEIEMDITMPDDDDAAIGVVFRSSAALSAGTTALPIVGETAYEVKIRDNTGAPYALLSNNTEGRNSEEQAPLESGMDISGQHVWRLSVWEDHYSLWCDDKFIWAFYGTTHSSAGYVGLRLYNHGTGAISYDYDCSVRELCERLPWFGYISGMTGQQAIQDLIRSRRMWWLERSDGAMEFSRFYVRDDLEAYTDLHEVSRILDDRSVASVVLVSSEDYAFYIHPATLASHGYRFIQENNPELDTEEECRIDATLIQRLSREQSDQRGYSTERARLEAEPEDIFDYGGVDYLVNNLSLSYGPARLTQSVSGRLSAT